MEVFDVVNAATVAISKAGRQVVGEKASHCLAQEPGSHLVLKLVSPSRNATEYC